jgi:hypothetical protein
MESEGTRPWQGLGELGRDSWAVFRERFWLLWGVTGFGAVVTLASAAVPLVIALAIQLLVSPGWWLWVVAVLASLSAGLWLGSWAQIAACEALMQEEAPSMTGCFERSWPKIAAFSWVCILYMVVAGGGLFLMLVPGIFLAVALIFAPFVCLQEGLGGFDALARSLEHARGRWPGLFGRLALIALAGSLPARIPWIGWLVAGVLAPLPLAALVRLYRDARTADASSPSPAPRWPLALAVAGWLVPAWTAARAGPELLRSLPTRQEQLLLLGSIDPAKAQRLLVDIQSGQASSLDVAVQAGKLLEDARARISSSTAPPAGLSPR